MKKSKKIKQFFRNRNHRRKQQAELVRKRSSSTATAMEELQPPPPVSDLAFQSTGTSGLTAIGVGNAKVDTIAEQSGQRCRKELKSYFSQTSCAMVVTKKHLPNKKSDRIVIPSANKEDARDCAICFETYRAGDRVVWNGRAKSCKHVFHEACVVNFVVNHERRRRKLYSSSSTLTAQDTEGYERYQDDHAHGPARVLIRIPCPICTEQYICHSYDEEPKSDFHRHRRHDSDENDIEDENEDGDY